MDWSRTDWPQLGVAVEAAAAQRGVPVGIIYNGGAATSDAAWLAIAGQRVLAYEDGAGAHPDHVLFQSWMDKPDRVLPEGEPTTFSAFVNRYFDDRASFEDATADRAFDGDADTIWNAGAGPLAGIEVDLGAAQPVTEIRLMVSQSPEGETHHRVSCLEAAGGSTTVLADLVGSTTDGEVLIVSVAGTSCRVIRVETLASPSWVAWREIEVVGGP
jgi:hypothetical protein